MAKPFWGMPMYEKKKEDVVFQTECGQEWTLKFEKTEYRAYVSIRGYLKPMYLGSIDTRALKEYILKTYREEVK